MREELKKARQRLDASGKKSGGYSRSKKAFKVVSTASFILIIVILLGILGSVLMAKSNGESVALFGYRLYVIESGSMGSTLEVGAVILVKTPEDSSALKVDDIVTFTSLSGSTVTHRIIKVVVGEDDSISYITKGDNPINSADVDPLTPDRIIGVFVAKIPLT
ncbi:MAG: signal peptidase I [Firmicutes bacterium HGW-Firmicutes-21]|nr:MAG: signal peptidase I [Firmicutes bacterium HGW-Firmicutes-21]